MASKTPLQDAIKEKVQYLPSPPSLAARVMVASAL